MSPEQFLIVADEFCSQHKVQIRSFSALVGAVAVAGAHLEGIRIFDTTAAAADALADAVVRLEPLNALNTEFSEVSKEVFIRLTRDTGVN